MKKLIITIGLLTGSVAWGQDIQHAPTVEQCRADYRLWVSQDKQDGVSFTDLTLKELGLRTKEMLDCETVDTQQDNVKSYIYMFKEFGGELLIRETHFLSRHGLNKQFQDEDAKGAR